MCEAVSGMIAQARAQATGGSKEKQQPRRNPLLIEDTTTGLPVGKGGRKRERRIMDIVDGAQTGLQIPGQ